MRYILKLVQKTHTFANQICLGSNFVWLAESANQTKFDPPYILLYVYYLKFYTLFFVKPEAFWLHKKSFTLLLRFTKHTLSEFKNWYSYLKLNGLGYRAWKLSESQFVVDLGFSHYYIINYQNTGIKVLLRKNKIFLLTNSLKKLSQFQNRLIGLKNVNPYTLKGIRVAKQQYQKKQKKKERIR